MNVSHPGGSEATIRYCSTGPLPSNAIIRRIYIAHTAEAPVQGNARMGLYLADFPALPVANTQPEGVNILGAINAGGTTDNIGAASSPDESIYSSTQGQLYLQPDYYIEENGKHLFLVVRKAAVSIFNAAAVVWVELLDAPLGPDEPIIPRGTEEEPVCVRICGGEPVPQPPLPPGPEPPQPPPPSGPAHVDVLAEPLPPATGIDTLFPMEAVGRICDAP